MDIVVGGAGQDQVVQVAQVAKGAQLFTIFIIAARGKHTTHCQMFQKVESVLPAKI